MLSISLSKQEEEPDFFDRGLIVNGVLLPSSSVGRFGKGERLFSGYVRDWEEALHLSAHPVSALAQQFESLHLDLQPPIPDFTVNADLSFPQSPDAPRLVLNFVIDLDEWAGPWSLGEYRKALADALESSGERGVSLARDWDEAVNHFPFRCLLQGRRDAPLRNDLDAWANVLARVIRAAQERLTADLDRNTLVTLFSFPQEISTACEQYLMYFVQFLRDLGIKAGANIKHEARQVLFSVTPDEGAEALGRIREALDIYLRLPDSPEFAAQAPVYGDIAVQQLQANIDHLKGQLRLAGAVLQARNAQIEALQLSTFTYQQLLATQHQAATLALPPPNAFDADAEPLVAGVIDVTKFKGKGFTVDLPEILRRLKRRLKQE